MDVFNIKIKSAFNVNKIIIQIKMIFVVNQENFIMKL